uniref:Uncharacterized protein n=1 Tax=Acrobeloides nanus TaxID=290746 RepID=A0A914E1F6_9BILA
MIGTNIPTSVFTLITFAIGLRYSWHTMMFSIPVVMFSAAELIGLTAIPARVHATIKRSISIIYGVPRVWKTYNEQVYQIANSFVAHASQTDLGISLWGFAVVSKPLILTKVCTTLKQKLGQKFKATLHRNISIWI